VEKYLNDTISKKRIPLEERMYKMHLMKNIVELDYVKQKQKQVQDSIAKIKAKADSIVRAKYKQDSLQKAKLKMTEDRKKQKQDSIKKLSQ
jgi:hypothetical protein